MQQPRYGSTSPLRRLMLLGCVLLLSLAFAQPARDQVIIGYTQEPTVFNPLMPNTEVDKSVHFHLFSSLWGVDENGTFFPVLAREVPGVDNGGISADGRIWTIQLRDDVSWHDGEPFTAEDVRFSLELIMDDDFRAGSRQGHDLITDIEVLGPTEIRWTMSESYASYLAILASTFMVPEHVLGAATDPNTADFNRAPIGTGPYMWGERVSGVSVTLTANPDYFLDGPHINTVVFKYVPDVTVLYTQFKIGEIDFTSAGISTDNYNDAITLPGREILLAPSPGVEAIWFNLARPQFQDPAVREALYYALDKQTVIDVIRNGLSAPTESFLAQQSWAYDADLPAHEYNPQKAIEILEAAGWKAGADGIREKDGVRLQFSNSTTSGDKAREQTQAYLQQTWREIGVALEITNSPSAVLWGEYWPASQYDTVMTGQRYGRGPDPDVTTFFHQDYIPAQGGSGLNSMQYANAEVSRLLDLALTTADLETRKGYYSEVQQIIHTELPLLPVFQYSTVIGMREGLKGFTPNANVPMYVWDVDSWYWE